MSRKDNRKRNTHAAQGFWAVFAFLDKNTPIPR
jgi:hypothetical protein